MADRRRRRPSEGESEDENEETSGAKNKETRRSECESEGEGPVDGGDNSEYESANEDNDDDDDDDEYTDDDEDDDDEDDETATYDGSVIVESLGEGEERQSGDGEEQPKEEVDDDEDRKNPAFVPRRGAFYEHDMRISMEDPITEEDQQRPKKKLWKDDGKWYHDRFREDQQGPKSQDELITMYGYDIRQYDKPPDAPKMNNRPRGRRSDQKSRLQDFVTDRPVSRRSPPSDYIQSKNNYNNQERDSKNNRYNNNRGRVNDNNNRSFHRSSSAEIEEERFTGGKDRANPRGQDRGPDRNYSNQDRGPDRNYSNQDRGPDRNYSNQDRSSNRNYSNQDRGSDRNNANQDRGQDRNYANQDRGFDREYPGGHDRSYSKGQDRGFSGQERGNRYRNSPSDRVDLRYEQNQTRSRDPEYSQGRQREVHRYERRERGGASSRAGVRGRSRRGRGGDFDQDDRGSRSYSDMRDNVTSNRGNKFPPRFQKHASRDYNDLLDEYGYHEGEIFRTTITTEPATKAIDTTVKDPSPIDPVSPRTLHDLTDKDTVQNVNIVISNTGERKSYSKDRRARDRAVGKTRIQDDVVNAVIQGTMAVNLQDSEQSVDAGDVPVKSGESTSPKSFEQKQNYNKVPKSVSSKQTDQGGQQGRSKRYSSQRQRAGQEAGFTEQAPPQTTFAESTAPISKAAAPVQSQNAKFYKPPSPGFVKQEGPGAPPFQPTMLRAPMAFPIPASTGGIPAQPPQVFVPPRTSGPPVTMTTALQMQPPQFINTGMMYGAPPAPFPVAPGLVPMQGNVPLQGNVAIRGNVPMQGFPSPPAVSTSQPPPPPPSQQVQSQQGEVYRGGTTYYPPELQQYKNPPPGTTYYPPELQFKSPHRSPVRRAKAAIPIVDPQAVKKTDSQSGFDSTQDLEKSPGSPSSPDYSDARSEEYIEDDEEDYMDEDPLGEIDRTKYQAQDQSAENVDTKYSLKEQIDKERLVQNQVQESVNENKLANYSVENSHMPQQMDGNLTTGSSNTQSVEDKNQETQKVVNESQEDSSLKYVKFETDVSNLDSSEGKVVSSELTSEKLHTVKQEPELKENVDLEGKTLQSEEVGVSSPDSSERDVPSGEDAN